MVLKSPIRINSRRFLLGPSILPSHPRALLQPRTTLRHQSTSSTGNDASTLPPNEPALSPRWLSDAKQRIGKCISFGLNNEQVAKAAALCAVLGRDWRELVGGSEGFLTGEKQAGLRGHRVVWGEMDAMQHVNNVTYTRYAESARVQWVYNFATYIDPANKDGWIELMSPRGTGLILRSIRTDYKFPMRWPDKVSVFHKLRSPPSASADHFILDVMILSENQQRPAARCVEDIVLYDYRKGEKTSMPPYVVEAFSETYKLQEEAKKVNTRRVWDILRQVEELEKESWDRPDAKEDFGSAA